jgi:hypothetical protein
MIKLASRAWWLVGALQLAACSNSIDHCMAVTDPEGLWARSSLARVDVYGASARCAGSGVAPGAGPAIDSREFASGQRIALDVQAGHHAIVLTLYRDAAGTQPIAAACSEGDFAAGSKTCLALEVQPIPDGGACGVCPAGSYCVGAACASGCAGDSDCGSGGDGGSALVCCAHACVDTDSNALNCSACGYACSDVNGAPTCTAGACTWTCMNGFAHCASGNTGCETNLAQTGLKVCGDTCIPVAACCASEECVTPPGPAACYDASCSGTSCAYTLHAGAVVCGATCCQPVHATCSASCALSCAPGYDDCDRDASNGCEQSLDDVRHCGSCSNPCLFVSGIAACSAGTCVLAGCDPGFINCDGNDANGCECAGIGCCGGGACQQSHANGLGQKWFDCVATGTYNATQALAACAAFTGDASQCHALTCSTGDLAVCSDGSSAACDCWIYSGGSIGRVKTSGAGSCGCNTHGNAPTWN